MGMLYNILVDNPEMPIAERARERERKRESVVFFLDLLIDLTQTKMKYVLQPDLFCTCILGNQNGCSCQFAILVHSVFFTMV